MSSRSLRTSLLLAALAILCAPAPAGADFDEDRALLEDERNTIDVFDRVSPSVVHVVNRSHIRDLFSGQTTEVARGTGSGFVWDTRGHIVTNYHVVHGGDAFSVFLQDEAYDAELVGAEPRRDIAVLRVKAPRNKLVPVVPGESRALRVGQKVLAIGSPFGLERTLTTGVVSALDREIVGVAGVTIPGMIQTDAAINPGNSGGPLLDSQGRLIGMNTMIYSRSGASAGIGFAVPVSLIRRIVPQIIQYGKAITPVLGVSLFPDSVARRLGIQGVIIKQVAPRSGAQHAGLRGTREDRWGKILLGDVIIAIDGARVKDYDGLYNALERHAPGDEVAVTVLRAGKKLAVKVRLSAM